MLTNENSSSEFILTNAGDKLYIRSKTDNTSIDRGMGNFLCFQTTQPSKLVDVSENIMSLLSPDF